MIYIASENEVHNLKHGNDNIISFFIGGEKYTAREMPIVSQGGAPAEVYYKQDIYDCDGERAGELRYEIVLSEEEQAEQTDESEMCDWDKFDVYM